MPKVMMSYIPVKVTDRYSKSGARKHAKPLVPPYTNSLGNDRDSLLTAVEAACRDSSKLRVDICGQVIVFYELCALIICTYHCSFCHSLHPLSFAQSLLKPCRNRAFQSGDALNGEKHIMSYAVQTPQRPLPGAYVPTPVVSRYQTGPPRPSFPHPSSNPSYQQSQNGLQSTQMVQQQPPQQRGQVSTKPPTETLSPIERASKVINETLDHELRYPDLDTIVGRM